MPSRLHLLQSLLLLLSMACGTALAQPAAPMTSLPATGPELVVSTGHTAEITDLAVSSSGTYLASAGRDGTIRLWHLPTATEVRRFRSSIGTPTAVGLARGKVFAFSTQSSNPYQIDSTAYQRWNAYTGRQETAFGGATGFVRSRTGNAFAASFPQGFAVYAPQLDTVRQVQAPAYMQGLTVTAVSAEGDFAVTTNSALEEVRLWDVARADSYLIEAPGATVNGFNAVFSPDGQHLYAVASDGILRRWTSMTGEPAGRMRSASLSSAWQEATVPPLALSDGRFLYAEDRTGVAVERSGQRLHLLGPHMNAGEGTSGYVSAVAVSPDGTVVYTGDDSGQIYAWAIGSEEEHTDALPPTVDLTAAPSGDASLASISARKAAWDGQRLYLSDAGASDFAPREDTARVWVIDPLHPDTPVRARRAGPGTSTVVFAAAQGRAFTRSDSGGRWLWNLSHPQAPEAIGKNKKAFPDDLAAFSPDGSLLLLGDGRGLLHLSDEPGLYELWDVAERRRLRRLQPDGERPPGPLTAAAFGPDAQHIVTGHYEEGLRLWDVATGTQLKAWESDLTPESVVWGPEGRRFASAHEDGSVRLWSVDAPQPTAVLLGHEGPVRSVAFAPDGATLASGGSDGTIRLWDPVTGTEQTVLDAFAPLQTVGGVALVGFTRDGRHLVATGRHEKAVRVWDTRTHRLVRTLTYDAAPVGLNTRISGFTAAGPSRRFPEDGFRANLGALGGGRVVALDADLRAWSWDTDDARKIWPAFPRYATAAAHAVALTARGDTALVGLKSGHVVRVAASTGRPADTLQVYDEPLVALAADTLGRILAAPFQLGSDPVPVRLWDPTTRSARTIFEAEDEVYTLAFGPDGRTALISERADGPVARASNEVIIVSLATGTVEARLPLGPHPERPEDAPPDVGPADALALSPDGTRLAVAQAFGGVQLWDLTRRKRLRAWDTHRSGLRLSRYVDMGGTSANLIRRTAVAFTPGGQLLVGAADGALILHDRDGHPVRSYPALNGRILAVEARDESGRSVVRALTEAGSLYAFHLDTGRLLAVRHQLADGRWATADADGRFDTGNLLKTKGARWLLPDAPLDPLPMEAFLRDYYAPGLMRRHLDGDSLSTVPPPANLSRLLPAVAITAFRQDSDSTFALDLSVRAGVSDRGALGGARDLRILRNGQLVAWKDGLLLDGTERETTRSFSGLALPSGADSVTVQAYAFNADGVKGPTADRLLGLPRPLPRRRGTAYVLSVGVNTFSDPVWNLTYAAADARAFQEVLPRHLEHRFDRVVAVPLISDGETGTQATKATLRAVLSRLSGTVTEADAPLLHTLPDAHRLRTATPDDAIFVTFSTHGFTDPEGTFYLLPEDVAPNSGGQLTPALLASAVSSDDLTDWLRDVDVGSFVMVVDACHSEASVATPGFKPGPFGSRGLGQLAYSKGMQVIAASQAEDVALELGSLRHGLLTFALVREGLEAGRARPSATELLTVSDWLRWAAARVPRLQHNVQQGRVRWNGRGIKTSGGMEEPMQRPAVFDFSLKTQVLLP